MLAPALVAVVLSQQFPVTLPRELGHLRLVSGQSTPKGVEVALEYENVTDTTFASVGIECTLFDHREVVVNDEYKVINNDSQGFAPGTRVPVQLVITDHLGRGRRTECAVTRGNKAEVQLAALPVEESPPAPVVRPRREPAVAPTPAPEKEKAPAPAPVAPEKVSAPPASKDPAVVAPAASTPAPSAVSAPPKVERAPAPAATTPAAEVCCKKCSGNTKACGDTCIPIAQKCRTWAGCACTVE